MEFPTVECWDWQKCVLSFGYLSGNFGSKSCVRKRRIVLKSKKRARSELLWFKSFLLFWHFSAIESLHAQVAVKYVKLFALFHVFVSAFFPHIFEAFPKMDGFPPYTVQAWRHFFFGKWASQLPTKKQMPTVAYQNRISSIWIVGFNIVWALSHNKGLSESDGLEAYPFWWEKSSGEEFSGVRAECTGNSWIFSSWCLLFSQSLSEMMLLVVHPTQATIPDHQCIWGTPATDNEAWWNLWCILYDKKYKTTIILFIDEEWLGIILWNGSASCWWMAGF